MRRKREAVLPFASNDDSLPKTVREYRESPRMNCSDSGSARGFGTRWGGG